MNERGLEVKVGILVTLCLGLLAGFVILLGDYSMSERSEIYLDTPTSADLKPGAPIKIAGTPSGKVTDVEYRGGEFDEEVGRRVWVRATLNIDADRLPTIHRDGKFYITTLGILGEKYIEIEPGTAEEPSLAPGDVVEGVPPLRLEIMASKVAGLVESMSRIIEQNEDQLTEIVGNANDTMKTVKGAVERVDKLIARTEPRMVEMADSMATDLPQLSKKASQLLDSANVALGDGSAVQRTIDNVEKLSRTARAEIEPAVRAIRKTLTKFESVADTGEDALIELRAAVTGLINRMRGTLTDVDDILASMKKVSAQIASGKGTIGALLADKEMYDDIREMMKDLKRHPWKFLWKE